MKRKNYRRQGHGYRSASEIRTKKIVDITFALIATTAIAVQIFLLYKYFDIRDEKKIALEKYKAEEQNMNLVKDKKSERQKTLDSLNFEIENLESELERLKSQ